MRLKKMYHEISFNKFQNLFYGSGLNERRKCSEINTRKTLDLCKHVYNNIMCVCLYCDTL